MPSRPMPNLNLSAGYAPGEDGWGDEMTANLRKLSVLAQAGASAKVAVEPAEPVAGDIVVLDETHATHPNAIAAYDDGAWAYFTPTEGWLIYNRETSEYLSYAAGVWSALVTAGDGGGEGGGGSYSVPFGFAAAPAANEHLLVHVFAEPVTFPADFVGARSTIGANDAVDQTIDIRKNGVTCGTISITAAGAVTFTSAGGTAVSFVAGDRLTAVWSAVAGTTIINSAFTLLGSKD